MYCTLCRAAAALLSGRYRLAPDPFALYTGSMTAVIIIIIIIIIIKTVILIFGYFGIFWDILDILGQYMSRDNLSRDKMSPDHYWLS